MIRKIHILRLNLKMFHQITVFIPCIESANVMRDSGNFPNDEQFR